MENLDGLAAFPPRRAPTPCATRSRSWLHRRYGLTALDPRKQVLPVNGTREALFAFAQAVSTERNRRARGLPESVLSDLRRRGAAGRRAAGFINQTAAADFAIDLEPILPD